MKKFKLKNILVCGLISTASIGVAAGVSVELLNNKQQTAKTFENKDNNFELGGGLGFQGSPVDAKDAYSFSLQSKTSTETTATEYVLTIDGNTKKEGVIFLVDKENNKVNELSFKPGDTIKIGIQLNQGYEGYTARELKIFGENENIYIPTAKDEKEANMFTAHMPEYDKTIDKKTGKSWLYNPENTIKVVPSFIKQSIGTNGSKVEWEHGAFYNSLNGYVYELKADTTWTTATQKIYETFESEDITNPIDIYFYLNGFDITFNVDTINLDVPSGWALHFYNNKMDTKAENGKYGEIKVAEGKTSAIEVGGSVTMGSSVKFKLIHGVTSVKFISYNDKNWIGTIENDPEVRLGGK